MHPLPYFCPFFLPLFSIAFRNLARIIHTVRCGREETKDVRWPSRSSEDRQHNGKRGGWVKKRTLSLAAAWPNGRFALHRNQCTIGSLSRSWDGLISSPYYLSLCPYCHKRGRDRRDSRSSKQGGWAEGRRESDRGEGGRRKRREQRSMLLWAAIASAFSTNNVPSLQAKYVLSEKSRTRRTSWSWEVVVSGYIQIFVEK